jgi:hypothetical protein
MVNLDRSWDDAALYKYFGLDNDDISFIEKKVKPMSLERSFYYE